MRCLSHIFVFKEYRTFKSPCSQMEKTRICYFCSKKIKKMSKKQLKKFHENFNGSLSPEYFPLSIGISE